MKATALYEHILFLRGLHPQSIQILGGINKKTTTTFIFAP